MIGVIGGGQLGRMLALAGYALGERFTFLDPSASSNAGHVGPLLLGAYDDEAKLAELARASDVVTYEFENVPVASARFLAERIPVFPPPEALEASQDRVTEKTFFTRLGIPTPAFLPASSAEELARAASEIGLPVVVKTRRFGYDGKGQRVLRAPEDVASAWSELGGAPLIVEKLVAFERELSILAVRSRVGETAFYPLVENVHRGGILRRSTPFLAPALQARAEDAARQVLTELGYVGVLAIELFSMPDGELLVNEMAPRVHNSGHWTIEGAETSQFENHVRAILGLPLGATRTVGFPAMLNVIGELPLREAVLAVPGAHLHVYGKAPAPGRKLGHVTVRAETAAELETKLALLEPLTRS